MITTVVVFLPISVMKGLSGQLFKQLGFTIIFSLTASLICALTLVPLFFSMFTIMPTPMTIPPSETTLSENPISFIRMTVTSREIGIELPTISDIIFSLTASLICALTLVPLFFSMFKPVERREAPISRFVRKSG